ncbi:MAG: GAF domain-containing sensor histidine kinase, partial [Deltaproteobacteria bacterium]|nr:GAF domain-containing sensor histidine kinase [Deltaproteobacteria bacterium]
VQKGLDPHIQHACAEVNFGNCLCGRAAADHQVQFAGCLDERHEVRFDGMPAHGQYCVPIVDEQTVLGVLNIYVREGHESTERETEFLAAVANILAGIVQRQRAQEERHQHELIALSRERLARVGEIATGVAHTIRNPLHGVLSCVEILEQNPCGENENVADLLGLMREGLERISRTTQRLLMLASGGSLGRRPTDVRTLINDVERMLGARVQAKGLILQVEIASLPPALLEIERVYEAVANVVGNAIDACSNGDVITIRASRQPILDATLLLEVEDRGEGIAEDNLHRVLDPFFSTKPVGEGSGLGLAMAQRVVADHGGSIAITSKEGEGTRVRMVFPGALSDGKPLEGTS